MKPFLIIYLACVATAFSQTYSGSETNVPVRLDLGGSYGGESFLNVPSTIAANVSLTPTTILYNSYSITSSTTPVLTLTQQFPVKVTFEFRTITTTLTLQPFVLSLDNFGPASLQYAGFGHVFNILELQGFSNVQFQGAYQISGPNETITGKFSVVLPPLSTYRSMPNQNLDVTGYPQSVTLGGTPLFSGDSTIFSGIVDGVALNIHADSFRFQTDTQLTVAQVPEPSSAVFLLFAGAAFLGCRTLRKALRTSVNQGTEQAADRPYA